jgi:Methyltransferase domain
MYEQLSAESERRGTARHRGRALAGLTGQVIEVGAGNGMNFSHYPDTVTNVVAIEPEDYLRALAERAAAAAPVPVRVLAGHATALPVGEKPWFGLLEDAITPLQSRIGGGCHPNRDTAAAIRAAGFDIEELDRFYYAPVRFYPSHAHILGRARPRLATR